VVDNLFLSLFIGCHGLRITCLSLYSRANVYGMNRVGYAENTFAFFIGLKPAPL
jgi:hypothetical protein